MTQGICSIEGCGEPHHSLGWCNMHSKRWRRHGDPLYERLTLEERFWSKVAVGGPDECWPWLAQISRGYGVMSRWGASPTGAHRLAYELLVGPIPGGFTVDHTCHNADLTCAGGPTCAHRRCCNPAHLEPVTARINTLRGRTLAAENAAKTHCPRGHPLSGPNLYAHLGKRHCRECMRASDRRRRAK